MTFPNGQPCPKCEGTDTYSIGQGEAGDFGMDHEFYVLGCRDCWNEWDIPK